MRTGDVVDGRYAILERAGIGGVGSVYRSFDRQTQSLVAVKVLHVPHATAQARFLTEARTLAGLEHPHIVRYVTHGIHDEEPYLVMEWLDGESLDRRLARERFTIDESIDVARRIASALGAAHARGIVHRDVKPSNVLLVDNTLDKLRLLDFGIARVDDAGGSLTRTGNVLGTPGYMSPEQARGDKRYIDTRADVFSLGCVLFECLTGQTPFHGPHAMAVIMKLLSEEAPRLRNVRPDAPEALDAMLAKMLAREPLGRFVDGTSVVNAIDALGSLKNIEPQPMSVRRRLPSSADVFSGISSAQGSPSDSALAMAPTMMGVSSLRELTDRYNNSDRPSSSPPEPRQSRRDSVPPPPPSVPPPSRAPSSPAILGRSSGSLPPSSVSSPGTVPPPSDRRWYERMPRAPGKSPFHVKGLAYKGLLHLVTTKIEGGVGVLAASMRDASLRDYITQTFLASTFYDALPLVAASAAAANLLNGQLDTFAQNQGRAQAKYDAEHAFRAFVQGRSVDDFPSRCKLIAARYFDFGEWEANSFSPGTVTFVVKGIPAWSSPWFGPLLGGYVSTMVQFVARKNASCTVYPTRRDATTDGFQTVIVEMDISF